MKKGKQQEEKENTRQINERREEGEKEKNIWNFRVDE